MVYLDNNDFVIGNTYAIASMIPSEVKEGKIELKADCDGLFVIDVERLNEINDIDQVMIASRHTNTPVKKGDKLSAGDALAHADLDFLKEKG